MPALAAARCASRLKRRLAARGMKTVYANDNYGRWRSDFQDILALCAPARGER